MHPAPEMVRNAQMVKARVIWSTKPEAVVPVLAVTRLGGQTFVYVAEEQNGIFAHADAGHVGDTVGNNYAVTSGFERG